MPALAEAVTYKLNGVPLSFVDSHRDLGVIVHRKLRFHQHVHSVVNLLRSTVNRSPDFIVLLFITHIRPILDYCCCVWKTGYVGNMRMLEAVQRR